MKIIRYSSISISGYISRMTESQDSEDIGTIIVIAALFTVAKKQKESKHPLMIE